VALMDILTSVDRLDHIWIEKQQAMPKQGVSSTFKLGYAFGQITTTVALSRTRYTMVTPVVWKRAMNLPKDKDAARRMAQQWFPDRASELKRKKDEHRAEALLIALYGRGKA
jgi:crossover junction endodeoxyribonuclease RuvC